jgi:hypothetical protein
LGHVTVLRLFEEFDDRAERFDTKQPSPSSPTRDSALQTAVPAVPFGPEMSRLRFHEWSKVARLSSKPIPQHPNTRFVSLIGEMMGEFVGSSISTRREPTDRR